MGKKTIILVRHGQYIGASENITEKLTPLGRKQARYAAKRLKEYKIDRMIHSTMPRAVETASEIKTKLEYKKTMYSCNLLREGYPGFPKRLRKKYDITYEKGLKADKQRIDKAFKKYFKPSRKDSTEVLVCHGNVIRYLVCKALEVETLSWVKMDIKQGAISIIEIRSKGDHRTALISHNEVGHIPQKHRTFK